MARPKQNEQIENLNELILEKAWELCGAGSPETLSLRAVARACNISAPAIYHYYANKGQLVTALIVDAYRSFTAKMVSEIAKADTDRTDQQKAFLNLAWEYRSWTLGNREKYALMFGKFPADCMIDSGRITEAAQPSLIALAGFFNVSKGFTQREEAVTDMLAPAAEHSGLSANALATAVSVWTRIHGLLTAEISQQYPPWITRPEIFFKSEIKSMIKELFV